MNNEKDFVAANVGQRIKNRREAKGETQAKLAELSYISTTYLGEVERGEKSPTLKSIFKIAVGLGIDPMILFKEIKSDIYLTIEKEVKENRLE